MGFSGASGTQLTANDFAETLRSFIYWQLRELAEEMAEQAVQKVAREVVRQVANKMSKQEQSHYLRFCKHLETVMTKVAEFAKKRDNVERVHMTVGDHQLRFIVESTGSTFDFALAEEVAELEEGIFHEHEGFPAVCLHIPKSTDDDIATFAYQRLSQYGPHNADR